MMNKYFTDEELIEALSDLKEDLYVQNNTSGCDTVIKAIERIEQKIKQANFQASRLQAAAEWIGHSVISESMEY